VGSGGGEVLAVIPARGGSKSIPRKNIRPFAGFPLLAWSIAAARGSLRTGRVVVSTDDPDIRAVAKAFGAEAPFLRPVALAADDTPDLPVFTHALTWLEREDGYRPELVVQIRPTSPLRPPGLIDEALAAFAEALAADSLRSVCAPGQSPYKMWRERSGFLEPLLDDGGPEAYNRPRQLLPPTLWQTGLVDVVRREVVIGQGSMTGARIAPFRVDAGYAIDIDTPVQWAMAEWLLAAGEIVVLEPKAVNQHAEGDHLIPASGGPSRVSGTPSPPRDVRRL